MDSHNGDKKTTNNQAADKSMLEAVISKQKDVFVRIFSYLDLKDTWRLSNVNRLIKQKFLSIPKLKEPEYRIPYKRVSDYEFSCNFVNYVYGKGNDERLSKIAYKVVKFDANAYEDKTFDELRISIPVICKQNYDFKKSIVYQIDKDIFCGSTYDLLEEMLWHMVLLDILNIKLVDFKREKPLPEEILDIVKGNSQNRLNFLFGGDKQYSNISTGGFAGILYDYAKLIFKLPDNNRDISIEQKELIQKIFLCFIMSSLIILTHISY